MVSDFRIFPNPASGHVTSSFPVKKIYDIVGTGKEELSFIDIGNNPDVRIKSGSKMGSYIHAGMFTMGIGKLFQVRQTHKKFALRLVMLILIHNFILFT